jgi:ATP/maltotriose-dependent transcriptional regulator MalT
VRPSRRPGAPQLLPAGQEQQHIFDLFAEEVLSHQEADLQRFLLEISILAKLTGSLTSC